jgi:hypothetical protein
MASVLSRARPSGAAPPLGAAFRAAAAAAITAGVIAGCGSAPATVAVGGSGAAPTRQVHVSPVTGAGVAVRGYRVISRASGASCEPGSEAIGQAYRCFAGNVVYDPCWPAKAASPTVLCVADPWLRTAAELKVSSALGAIPATGANAGEPWGVQLASGQRCVLAQGAHNEFSGQVIDYYCTPGLALLRGLNRKPATWTARSVLTKAGRLVRGPAEQIQIAWYGNPARSH